MAMSSMDSSQQALMYVYGLLNKLQNQYFYMSLACIAVSDAVYSIVNSMLSGKLDQANTLNYVSIVNTHTGIAIACTRIPIQSNINNLVSLSVSLSLIHSIQ